MCLLCAFLPCLLFILEFLLRSNHISVILGFHGQTGLNQSEKGSVYIFLFSVFFLLFLDAAVSVS